MNPLYDFGGSGPVLHLAPANGFPPATYAPLLQPLTDHYRVVCLPPRALWPGVGPAPTEVGSWRELADDMLAGMAQHDLRDVIGIGHSFGAIASVFAALDQPERFRGLILLDPTILAPAALEAVRAMREQGLMPRFPLVQQALARRQHFSDESEAFTYWRGKPLFRDWPDDALWLYTRSLAVPDGAGGLTLSWPPDWEAYYYMGIESDSLDALAGLRVPTLIIAGGTTDTFVPAAVSAAQERLPQATYATIPGHGHLFPHTAPDAARAIITRWLDESR